MENEKNQSSRIVNTKFRDFLSNIAAIDIYDETNDDESNVDLTIQSSELDYGDENIIKENEIRIENLNEPTKNYLNMLGEDLFMEDQDILVNDSKLAYNLNGNLKENSSRITKTKKGDLYNPTMNPELKFQIDSLSSIGEHDSFHGFNASNLRPLSNRISIIDYESHNPECFENQCLANKNNEFLNNTNKFELSKLDLINLIDQLNKDIELERFEKAKLKKKLNILSIENKKKLNLIENYNLEREELIKEYNNIRQQKQKETKQYKGELEAITREYSQIMSERDLVHKEMEALQEQLSKAQDRLKKYARESIALTSPLTNNELNTSNYGTLTNMSTNLNENLSDMYSNRQTKVNSVIYGYNNGMGSLDESLEIDSLKQQLSLVTRQRDDAIIQIKDLYYQLGKMTGTDFNESQLIERFINDKYQTNLKPEEENERLKYEIKELTKEIENSKKRRDMAFNERDKMLKERESIRGLCDDMRQQRDKAISELAEAIHETDELKKQKNMAHRQIQMLEDNVMILEEKIAYLKQMEEMKQEEKEKLKEEQNYDNEKSMNNSYEEDLNNWKTLRIEIELNKNNDIGIELAHASTITAKQQADLEENEASKLNNKDSELSSLKTDESTISLQKNLNQKSQQSSSIHSLKNQKNDTSTDEDVQTNAAFTESNEHDLFDNYTIQTSNFDLDDKSYADKKKHILTEDSGKEKPNSSKSKIKSQNESETNIQKTDGEELILISQIDPNGLAYGKLKVYDRLLKINDINIQNMKIESIEKTIKNLKGTVSFIISRYFGKSNDSLNRHSIEGKSDFENDVNDEYEIERIQNIIENDNENDNEDFEQGENFNQELISTSISLSSSEYSVSKLTEKTDHTLFNQEQYGKLYSDSFSINKTNRVSGANAKNFQLKLNKNNRESFVKKKHAEELSKQNNIQKQNSSDSHKIEFISIEKYTLNDLLLETGVYIAAMKEQNPSMSRMESKSENEKNFLSVGDRILSINGLSLTNKTLYEIVDIVNQSRHFNLVVQKHSPRKNPTIDDSLSNSPSNLYNDTLNNKHLLPNKDYFVVSQTISNQSSLSISKLNNKTKQKIVQKLNDKISSSSGHHMPSRDTPKPTKAIINANKNCAKNEINKTNYYYQQQAHPRSQENLHERTPEKQNRYSYHQSNSKNYELYEPASPECITYKDNFEDISRQKTPELCDRSATQMTQEEFATYKQLVKNFHAQNRKETQIYFAKNLPENEPKMQNLKSGIEQEPDEHNNNDDDENETEKNNLFNSNENSTGDIKNFNRVKKAIFPKLMQFSYKRSSNLKHETDKQNQNLSNDDQIEQKSFNDSDDHLI